MFLWAIAVLPLCGGLWDLLSQVAIDRLCDGRWCGTAAFVLSARGRSVATDWRAFTMGTEEDVEGFDHVWVGACAG